MNDVADNIDYGTIHTLEGNRYRFLKECAGEAMVYHPSVDPTLYPVTFTSGDSRRENQAGKTAWRGR